MKYSYFVFAISFVFGCSDVVGQPSPTTQLAPGAIGGLPAVTPEATTPKGPKPFPNPAMQARFDTVKAYMRLPSPLQYGNEYCAMLGDEAAFFIYILMSSGPPLTATQTLTALDIIHKSFARPVAIVNGADRVPHHSLALLKMFQATAVEQAVKERVAIETNFLNAVPVNIEAAPMGVPVPRGPTTPFFSLP